MPRCSRELGVPADSFVVVLVAPRCYEPVCAKACSRSAPVRSDAGSSRHEHPSPPVAADACRATPGRLSRAPRDTRQADGAQDPLGSSESLRPTVPLRPCRGARPTVQRVLADHLMDSPATAGTGGPKPRRTSTITCCWRCPAAASQRQGPMPPVRTGSPTLALIRARRIRAPRRTRTAS
jgi:hypothetical protein